MLLSQDFKEFIQSLNENKVKYLVVGGYAVAFHGHPHYTKDIDIWLSPDKKNVEGLLRALEDFGFASLALKIEDFLDPEQIIQLGYPPNRIDLMTDLDGIDFKTCYDKKIEVNIEGININFIDLENLKKNKKVTGRHQDLADLENLE
jgi:predicted nucleotidyltransferase